MGGVIAAPIAAWLISRINPVALGGVVGTAIVVLNVPKVVDAPAWVLVALGVVGVTLTVRGTLAYRAARKEVDTVEPAADEGEDDAAREGEDDAAREGASASAREYAYSPATSPMT